MILHNSFVIPAPPAHAWTVLNDVPLVARCAPGAELLEARDDGSYLGAVAVRLGPIALRFRGEFAYKERDAAAYRVVAQATGNETQARGTARAGIVFTLASENGGTRVSIETNLQLAGAVAQFGRSATIVQSTAQVLVDGFARNLAAAIEVEPVAQPQPISGVRLGVTGLWRTLVAWMRGLVRR